MNCLFFLAHTLPRCVQTKASLDAAASFRHIATHTVRESHLTSPAATAFSCYFPAPSYSSSLMLQFCCYLLFLLDAPFFAADLPYSLRVFALLFLTQCIARRPQSRKGQGEPLCPLARPLPAPPQNPTLWKH